MTYWVSTGRPWSSELSSRTTSREPELPTLMAWTVADVTSSVPGTSGWWKCMSCSPWTMNMRASAGTTSTADSPISDQTGTTPNTGGANLPAS